MFTPCFVAIKFVGKATCQKFLPMRLHIIGGVASCQAGAGVCSSRVGPRRFDPIGSRMKPNLWANIRSRFVKKVATIIFVTWKCSIFHNLLGSKALTWKRL
jgi:hypothetical protein